jgi:hypothetical protein
MNGGRVRDAREPEPKCLSSTGELIDTERVTISSEGGRWKSTHRGNSLAAYPTSRTGLTGGMGRRTGRQRALCLPSPWSDGTTGITLSPLELLEKLAALVPLPHVHLVRYSGCLAPHSHLRGSIIPTPRQQGLDGEEVHTGTPYWPWAKLLGRVFGLDMSTCPFCRRGTLRIIAVITQESVITRILRHLQLASVPPPIAPASWRQEISAFD